MANNTFQIRRTTTSARTPNTTNSSNTQYINTGELALNLTDKILYSSDGTNLITIGANLSTLNVTGLANVGNVSVTNTVFLNPAGTTNGTLTPISLTLATSNSTANGFVANTSAVIVGNTLTFSTYAAASANVLGAVIANATGVYTSGVMNAASYNVGTNFIANTTQVTIAAGIPLSANGGVGSATQVLTSNGGIGSPYWAAAPGGGATNVTAQYAWTNTQSFSNTISFYSIVDIGNSTITSAANLVVQSNTGVALITVANGTSGIANVNIVATGVTTQSNSTTNSILGAASLTIANTAGQTLLANVAGIFPSSNAAGQNLGNTISYWANVYANNLTLNGTLSANVNNINVGTQSATTNGTYIANNTITVGNTLTNTAINPSNVITSTVYANVVGPVVTLTGNVTVGTIGTTLGSVLSNNSLQVGNSTVNASIQQTFMSIGSNTTTYTNVFSGGLLITNTALSNVVANTAGLFVTNTVNAASHSVGTSVIANATGVYTTGVMNAASYNVGTNFIANTTQVTIAAGIPLSANGGVGSPTQVLTSNGGIGSPYWSAAGGTVSNTSLLETDWTGNGSNTVYTLSTASTQNNVLVTINGLLQPTGTYTIVNSNTTITFAQAPALNDVISAKTLSGAGNVLTGPAGSNTQIQYNNSGILAGDANLTYTYSNSTLIMSNTASIVLGTSVIINSTSMSILPNFNIQSAVVFANGYPGQIYAVSAGFALT